MKERNYTMRAQRMLSLDLPVLALTDPVSRALTVMDEFKLMHLPVVEEDVYKGTVSEATLLELDESALIAEAPMIQDAIPHDLHVYDVVARMGWSDVDVLPVVHEGLYRGAVDRAAVLRFMAKRAGWGFPGSTLVLEVLSKDLSPAELVRIVEADGAQITSFNVAPVEDSEFLEVTFKVNTEEIESIMATLRRHEYQVQSFYNAPELEDEMRARFDAFMRYLEP
ncbi:MAG: CBS domain-containing protein [Bacteroidota bacterium]|nr:CBS domain-containing protein [Bacteroidota bacterium]